MTTQEQRTSLPDPSQAYEHLYRNIHTQVFFNKLASAGYQPQNEKEAEDLLSLAGSLRQAEEQEKSASAVTSRFGAPLDALNGVMGDMGYSPASDLGIKQAAADLMEDPEIYNSVLAVKAAEAEYFASQTA